MLYVFPTSGQLDVPEVTTGANTSGGSDTPRRANSAPAFNKLSFTLGEADRLDIMTVGIEHERAVVRWTVMRPRTGAAVVAATGLHRRVVEFAHGRAILRQNRDVRVAVRCAFSVPNTYSLAIGSGKARVLLLVVAENLRIPERCERRLVEGAAPLKIRNSERNVIDHGFCPGFVVVAAGLI